MNINNTVTMVVGLVVGVLLVAGAMTPIIADTIDQAGGDGGSSGAYTNTGEIYLKNSAGINTTVRIENSDGIKIYIDDALWKTMSKGTESWSIPLITATNDGWGYIYALTYQYSPAMSSDAEEEKMVYLSDYEYKVSDPSDLYMGESEIEDGGYIIIEAMDGWAVLTVYHEDGTENENASMTDTPIDSIISKEGEWVYAEHPVVSATTDVILYPYSMFSFNTAVLGGADIFAGYFLRAMGVGIYSEWEQSVSDPSSILATYSPSLTYFVGGSTDNSGRMDLYDLTYEFNGTEVSQGYRIDSIILTSSWGQDDNTLLTFTDSYTKFIVPTVVDNSIPNDGTPLMKADTLLNGLSSDDYYEISNVNPNGNKYKSLFLYLHESGNPEGTFVGEIRNDSDSPRTVSTALVVSREMAIIWTVDNSLSPQGNSIQIYGFGSGGYESLGIAHGSQYGDLSITLSKSGCSVSATATYGSTYSQTFSVSGGFCWHPAGDYVYADMDWSASDPPQPVAKPIYWQDEGYALIGNNAGFYVDMSDGHTISYTLGNPNNYGGMGQLFALEGTTWEIEQNGISVNDGIHSANVKYAQWRSYDGDGEYGEISDGYSVHITVPSADSENGYPSEEIDSAIGYILPAKVSVDSGGSGGSGLSPTLKTMLTVIPLVMTVGLVLGAVTYLRMKN